jgi:hypothetical protein
MIENTKALWRALSSSNEVKSIRSDIKLGKITKKDIETEVEYYISKYKPGYTLEDEIALCGIVVSVDGFDIGKDILEELSNSKSIEIRKPSRLVRTILLASDNERLIMSDKENLGVLGSLARLDNGSDRTDKGYLDHGFVEVYEKFFYHLRNSPIRILEIGIYDGGSLGLWYDYFPNAKIFGIDLSSKTHIDNDRITTFIADQSNRSQLKNFIDTHGGDFDIIIDDGGHYMDQQQISFGYLFPFVKSFGYYIIEDLHTSLTRYHSTTFKATTQDSTLCMIESFIRSKPPSVFSNYMTSEESDYISKNVDYVNVNTRNNSSHSTTSIIKKK